MNDLAIRNVLIFNGTGGDPFLGDVGIGDGRVAEVGEVGRASRVIDGLGRALAPGFIDAHTHDDGALLRYPDMWFKTNQGITTVVIGNCGFGVVGSGRSPATRSMLGLSSGFGDLEEYRESVAANPPAVNAIALVGHNSLREALVGAEERDASAAQVRAMRELVQRSMEQGACGLSTGLLYAPGKWAPWEELVTLARCVAPFGGIYASHVRDEFDRLLPSVAEAMRVGREAGVPTQISHHKAAGRANWGTVATSLGQIDRAVEAGQDVTLDAYPYTAGSGPLAQYFRDGIDLELAEVMRIASCPSFPEFEGRMLVELAVEEECCLEELVQRILDAPGADRTICLQFLADEGDIEANLRHPRVMVGSDGIPELSGSPHPRLVGTFPRVLGRYVRERGVSSLTEMVRRMTSLPADRFGLTDRGRIQPGHHADLVLFDPDTVVDAATYDEPLHPCVGVELVLVGGEAVWSGGKATAARPGRLLRFGRT